MRPAWILPLEISDNRQSNPLQPGLLKIFLRKSTKLGTGQFPDVFPLGHWPVSHANLCSNCTQISSTRKPKGVGRYIRRGTRPESSENFSASETMSPFCSMRPNVTYTVPRLSLPCDWETSWSPYIDTFVANSSKIAFSFEDSLGNSCILGSMEAVLHNVRLIAMNFFSSDQKEFYPEDTRPRSHVSPPGSGRKGRIFLAYLYSFFRSGWKGLRSCKPFPCSSITVIKDNRSRHKNQAYL